MSLSYTLELQKKLEPKQLLQLLIERHNLQWHQDTISGKGIWVNAYTEDDADNQSLTKEEFGFIPSTIISFRINTDDTLEIGERTLIRAVMTLLQQVTGNAILLFNYENLVLQRINNKLIFNKDMWEEWTANEMERVNIPYELKQLASTA